MTRQNLTHPKSLIIAGFAMAACVSTALGQYGAAPSQTSLFFDDLRYRSAHSTLGSSPGVRSGEAEYSYEQGEYLATDEDGRLIREPQTVSSMNEAARRMGQPAFYNASMTYAARSVGDYTYYSGQYASPSTFFAPPYISDPFLGGRRNLKLGGVNVGLGYYGAVEYNDNITRASSDPVSDFIGTSLLTIDSNYQVSKHNQLSLRTTLGFDHYFEHPELSPYGSGDFVLNVLPGSTIAFDLKLGPVYVVIYDRFSVRPAVRNDFALAANQIFGVFQNDAGMAATWDINSSLAFSLNYMHSNARSLEDRFEVFDRDMDTVQANLTWQPTGTWSLGIEGGASWVHYPQGFNNDGLLLNGGVVFATPIGKSSFLRVGAGVQSFEFDSPPEIKVSESDLRRTERIVDGLTRLRALQAAKPVAGLTATERQKLENDLAKIEADLLQANLVLQTQQRLRQEQLDANTQDSSDLDDYYFNVTFSNQLSSRVTQVISFGHESALSNVSNYVTADYINYGIGIIAWRGSRISVSAYYEDADMSGGRQAEDLTQHGYDIYISQSLNSWCRVGGGYHYGHTDSSGIVVINGLDRDYEQHAFSADINILITRRTTLSFGYRYFTTIADNPVFDFDQNRFVMAVNCNF